MSWGEAVLPSVIRACIDSVGMDSVLFALKKIILSRGEEDYILQLAKDIETAQTNYGKRYD